MLIILDSSDTDDIFISYGFEDELNTVVTFLSCWFTRPKKSLFNS